MLVSRSPFRDRRRFALIIAIMASVTLTENRVRGQSAAEINTPVVIAESTAADASRISEIADVIVAPLKSLPAGALAKRPPLDQSNLAPTRDSVAPPSEPTKSKFVFSPIELRSIPESIPEVTLPPEIAARRNEIERKSLVRIFAGGMITTDINTNVQPLDLIQDEDSGAIPSDQSPVSIAFKPQQSVFPNEMIDAGVLDQPPLLSNPPLVSDKIEEGGPIPLIIGMPTEFRSGLIDGGLLRSVDAPMLETNPSNLQALPPPFSVDPNGSLGHFGPNHAMEMQLPNFALPGGGLDIFQLAPTRFARPLPNAR